MHVFLITKRNNDKIKYSSRLIKESKIKFKVNEAINQNVSETPKR